MDKGHHPIHCGFGLFCFSVTQSTSARPSLPCQNWTPWVPASCFPVSVLHPSLAASSFPESLQGPHSERIFQNHSPEGL